MKRLLGLLFCAPLMLWAQSDDLPDGSVVSPCATYNMQEALLESSDEIREAAEVAKAELEAFTQSFSRSDLAKDGTPYIIPVVFHIVHNGGSENISDAQVEDCIRVLNEDFNAGNSGLSAVVEEFQPIIGDVGVEFRLAQLDPDGNCTKGIVRRVSSNTNSGGENLKVVSPTWGRDKYLNVWVCRTIASGAAGYAFNPFSVNGPSGEGMDGIVVRSDYVGAIGTSSPGRSHTMSHEVAHWINISHVWGPTNDPNLDSNCDLDDSVADTPNSRGWQFCQLDGESCGALNNVENFMEYSGCGKMFTEGQAERMIASLEWFTADRNNLWQPENLESTGVSGPGVLCEADFLTDRMPVICPGEALSFTDISYHGVTEYSWNFEGGNPSTSDAESPNVVWNTPGKYAVTLEVSNAGGSMSVTKESFVTVLEEGEFLPPYSEGFESYTSFEPEDHVYTILQAEEGEHTWELTDDASYTGSKSIYVRGRSNSDGTLSHFITPSYDLSNVSETAVLNFKYAHARRFEDSNDVLRVFISRDCGETWIPRRTIAGNSLPTVPGNVVSQFFPDGQDEWEAVEISNIVGPDLAPSVIFRFEFRSFKGNNVYIDDINIYDLQAVGLNDIDFLKELVLYPNPTNMETTLSFHLDKPSDVTIQLYDMTGRLIKHVFSGALPSGKSSERIDVSDVSQGVYLVRILAEDGQVMKRMVVNH